MKNIFDNIRKGTKGLRRENPDGLNWDEDFAYAEEDGYSEDVPGENLTEEYAQEPEYAEDGYAQEAQYAEDSEYAQETQYAEEPEYEQEAEYAGEAQAEMQEPESFEAERYEQEFAQEDGYTQEVQYAGESEYAQETQYAGEPEYGQEAEYAGEAQAEMQELESIEAERYEQGFEQEFVQEDGYAQEAQYAGEPEYRQEAQYAGEAQAEYPVGETQEFTQEFMKDIAYAQNAGYAGEEQDYAETAGFTGEVYYAEEPPETGYAKEDGYAPQEYPEEDGYAPQEYPEEDGYAQEQPEFSGEILYTEAVREEPRRQDAREYDASPEYAEDERSAPVKRAPANRAEQGKAPANGKKAPQKKRKRAKAAVMDAVVAFSAVAVLFLAVGIGLLYYYSQKNQDPYAGFSEIGKQLQGIELIGGKGIAAVANAQMDKQVVVQEPEKTEEPPEPTPPSVNYEETDYTTTVAVAMKLTSVKKDLKIKFSNRETAKLVGNVRFVAQVTKPDGTVEEWTDSDMDGIIYQKDIADGNYQIALKALDSSKYPNYILPAGSQSVEVKKNIEYTKVDVTGEGKKEEEINANLEDTKIHETNEESSLKDTVEWVPSTSSGNTYKEVLKSEIPDPMEQKQENADGDGEGGEPKTAQKLQIGQSDGAKTAAKSQSGQTAQPKTTEKLQIGQKLSELKSTPKPDEKFKLTLDTDVMELQVARRADGSVSTATETARASVKGADIEDVEFSCKSKDESVATATISAKGKITVTARGAGSTTIKVTAKYGDESSSKSIEVNVNEKPPLKLKLDKTELVGTAENDKEKLVVKATVKNSSLDESEITDGELDLLVETSDAKVAKVTEKKITAGSEGSFSVKLTITPEAVTEKKSCVLTVEYTEDGDTVSASCTITIKPHPKNDKETKLLDNDGKQLYVCENEVYREAVYADYYTDVKFFVRAEGKYTGWQTIDGKVYFFDANGNYVTGEQVIQGAKYTFDENGVLVSGSATLGIDVSKWNGAIDWKAVKNSGVNFVIIRCGYRGSSQGMLIEDPKYTANIQGAIAAGLKVGVYFFTQAVDEVEAVYEASYVLEKIKDYNLSYPVFLDVEPSGGRGDKIDKATRTKVCKAFCQTIQNAGYTAGIYANKTWLNEKIDANEISAYKIWLAQYAQAPTYTGRYDMWQYKCTGKVSGINGNVDMNLSYMGY